MSIEQLEMDLRIDFPLVQHNDCHDMIKYESENSPFEAKVSWSLIHRVQIELKI